jgi:molybdopterin molybdotransferase
MGSPLLSFDEASARVRVYAEALLGGPAPKTERVSLGQAQGRILAEPLVADRDQPSFPRATRDGFAVRAKEASSNRPLTIAGAIRAGDPPAGPLLPGTAWEIMTGAAVPEGADAVVMIEHVEVASGTVRLLPPRTIEPDENFVPRGAEARAGDTILAPGVALTAASIALAAFSGFAELDVYRRPRVAILCTGDEIVPVDESPKPGQIRNSNGPMLAALVAQAGGEPWLLPTVADTEVALNVAIAQALEADLVLATGGVSAGKYDLVEPALERAGFTFHFTGVRIQPGKPTVLATLPVQNKNGTKCFFGLPGNPISSAATFLLFAAPVVAALGGRSDMGPRFATARLAKRAKHDPALTRFMPAHCTFGAANQWPTVERLFWQGSGDLATFARSNCFLVLPEEQDVIEAGTEVRILLF